MDRGAILAVVAVQAVSGALLVASIAISLPGVAPLAWVLHESTEIGAAAGLVLGTVLGGSRSGAASGARGRRRPSCAASGAIMELLEERFAVWGLTPAKRDVALFAIKGMTTPERAALRGTSEGTVQAQTTAVRRKAGATGRPHLLSLFVEDLMAGPVLQDASSVA